jgi:hypothetical protein
LYQPAGVVDCSIVISCPRADSMGVLAPDQNVTHW